MKQNVKSDRHPVAKVASSILSAMVRHPNDLQIRDSAIGTILAIEIEAHEDDRPRLIGSQGKHIAAFTRVLKTMGATRGLEVVIDLIVPPSPARHAPQQPFEPDPTWKSDSISALLGEVCQVLFTNVTEIKEHALKNMTIFKVNPLSHAYTGDVLSALDILFEAIGYRQGRVVHIAGPGVLVGSK